MPSSDNPERSGAPESEDRPIVGREIRRLAQADSTNDLVKEAALAGEAEGLVVCARAQVRGRGRRGRAWLMKPGQGVCLSVLLRPPWPESEAAWLGVLGAVAAAQAARTLGVQAVTIKWPNDVLVRGRKMAGILVEPRLSGGHIDFAVLGIGLNVLQTIDDFDPSLRALATSCAMEGCAVSVDEATRCVVETLDEFYRAALHNGPSTLATSWRDWAGTPKLPEH